MLFGKSPGQDGLTTNFYKFFWEDIKDLLFKALKECCESNFLLPTMKWVNYSHSKVKQRQKNC